MELDFTKLNGLSFSTKLFKKQPSEDVFKENEYKSTPITENALQGKLEGLRGVSTLQRQANTIKQERERAIAIYKEYQKNVKLFGQLQTDILKGAKRGENIYRLFLKAVQAIGLMTSNTAFYNQLNDDIRIIYGAGLLEPKPLELELEEVQERLQRLREISQRNTEQADSLQRIERAIQEHEDRARQLTALIAKIQSGESLTA